MSFMLAALRVLHIDISGALAVAGRLPNRCPPTTYQQPLARQALHPPRSVRGWSEQGQGAQA